jgi:hypothetical protein
MGRPSQKRLGLTNITWMAGSAETVVQDGPFPLASSGTLLEMASYAYELAQSPTAQDNAG